MHCHICRSEKVFTKYQLFDDRYGYDGDFTLVGCKTCSHLWLNCRFTLEQLSNIYSTYYPYNPPKAIEPGTMEGEKLRKERRITTDPFHGWLYGIKSSASRWVPKNVRLLDIGCGIGGTFKYHIERGCDVYGIEANENIRSIIEKSGYKIHVGVFEPDLYEPEYFDYVTMDQVLEHMIDPLLTIQGIFQILKPRGKLVLTTPNAKGWGAMIFRQRWIHWHAPYHLHFFSRQSLEYLANQAGFEIMQRHIVTHSSWLNMQWMHMVKHSRKGIPSVFWGKHLPRAGKMPEDTGLVASTIVFFDEWRINDLITRFLDWLQMGDNQVYILEKKQ